MKHISCFGSTCWGCGRGAPLKQVVKLADGEYLFCRDCGRALTEFQGTGEMAIAHCYAEIKGDLVRLVGALQGQRAIPRYYTGRDFLRMQEEWRGQDLNGLVGLLPKPWVDEQAEGTKKRLQEKASVYNHEAYLRRKELNND